MRSRYLVVTALVCTQGFFASAAPITVNRAMVFQTLEGFGAQGAAKAWSESGPYFDSTFVHKALWELGLSVIRDDIPFDFIKPNGDTLSASINWSNYALDGDIRARFAYYRELRRQAVALGVPLKLAIVVFSPPAWMKTNGDINNGGGLRPTLYNEFAKGCEAYVRAVADSTGINVYSLSLQNEPRWSKPTPSCVNLGGWIPYSKSRKLISQQVLQRFALASIF